MRKQRILITTNIGYGGNKLFKALAGLVYNSFCELLAVGLEQELLPTPGTRAIVLLHELCFTREIIFSVINCGHLICLSYGDGRYIVSQPYFMFKRYTFLCS